MNYELMNYVTRISASTGTIVAKTSAEDMVTLIKMVRQGVQMMSPVVISVYREGYEDNCVTLQFQDWGYCPLDIAETLLAIMKTGEA